MSLMDMISKALSGGDAVGTIAQKLGVNPAIAKVAIAAALPMIVAALAKNTTKPGGAAALDGALAKHDGSILNDLVGMLGSGAAASDGNGILGHILGGKREAVEQGVAQSSGLDLSAISKLLPMLAPIVMGALGKAKREQGLDASGVAAVVDATHADAQAQVQAQTGGSNPLLDLLDSDHDGSLGVGDLGGALDMLKKLT